MTRKAPLKPSQRVIEFIEKYCMVPEGATVGQPFRLRPWQREIIEQCYDSPTRRMFVTMGRKNGKTGLAASLLLCHLSGPLAHQNSQIFSTAMSREQAAVIFGLASKMVMMNDELAQWVTIRAAAKSLHDAETGVTYRALASDSSTAYGLSPIMTFHDELGQVRGPVHELYSAMESGSGAHRSPLSLAISTQAASDSDLLSVLLDDALRGESDRVKVFMRCATAEDDPFEIATWHKANPALGDFLSIQTLQDEADAASRLPARLASFQNLHLNMRVECKARFVAQTIWAKNSGAVTERMLSEALCVRAGLDLSSRQDLTALVLVFDLQDGRKAVVPHFWIPAEGLVERSRKEHVPYDEWSKRGLLHTCHGHTIDYDFVSAEIASLHEKYDIQSIAYDRWRIDDLNRSMERMDVAVPLVAFGQGFKDMSPAIEDLETLLLAGNILHGNHPVLTYCAESTTVVSDPSGNRKFDKARSTGKIDGMVALAMAVRIAMTGTKKQSSVYDSRGIVFL